MHTNKGTGQCYLHLVSNILLLCDTEGTYPPETEVVPFSLCFIFTSSLDHNLSYHIITWGCNQLSSHSPITHIHTRCYMIIFLLEPLQFQWGATLASLNLTDQVITRLEPCLWCINLRTTLNAFHNNFMWKWAASGPRHNSHPQT